MTMKLLHNPGITLLDIYLKEMKGSVPTKKQLYINVQTALLVTAVLERLGCPPKGR